jgi:uncharacterized protein (TIGR02246 family)
MDTESSASEVAVALDRFDATFASGDPDALAELFAVGARLLLLHREPIEGREAIREHWNGVFGDYDPGAWRSEHEVIEVHGDRAYTLSVYSEMLVPRGEGVSLMVRGRLILFLVRDPDDGVWRVTIALNSHSRPVERLASDGEIP